MLLDEMIERFIELRDLKTTLNRQVKEATQEQTELEARIRESMAVAGITRAGSPLGMVSVKTTPQPAVTDWGEFQTFIAETGSFELLQRRLSAGAFRERWVEGEEVPGTTKIDIVKLSVTRS
jgi:hypothetical protein